MVRIGKGQTGARRYSITGKIATFLLIAIAFVLGKWFSAQSYETEIHRLEQASAFKIASLKEEISKINQKGREQHEHLTAQIGELATNNDRSIGAAEVEEDTSTQSYKRFDETTDQAVGLARIDKDQFMKRFDYGTPVDKGGEVILMYNTQRAIPKDETIADMVSNSDRDGLPLLNVDDATANCDYMTVTTVPFTHKYGQCLAIVQNYDNWHTQKWLRMSGTVKSAIDSSLPLRSFPRGQGESGFNAFKVPEVKDIEQHWSMLKTYLSSVDDVLNELEPLAKKVATKNTVIVMTCNHGQSELLMNFVCNAKAKGFSTDNILLFPTDEETQMLAEGLGLATYYDKRNFEDIPESAAGRYMDKTFTSMMFAKVVCVQLINYLGYDLLFQDVDVVWFKNPLEYFHDENNEFHDFDMYFQDDGAHGNRYAPTSANSGFYYVRNNPLTRYMMISLLYHGDMIIESGSHQEALIQIMAEHSSQFGLRVKVLDREMKTFPGGFQFHRRKRLMKEIFSGEVVPEIFHMSWTANKKDKKKYLEQMGQWYVNSKCVGKTSDAIIGEEEEQKREMSFETPLVEPCCLVKPEIICHYRDKPSIVPCKDSPPIDKGRPSFW